MKNIKVSIGIRIKRLFPYVVLCLAITALSRQIQYIQNQQALGNAVAYINHRGTEKSCHIAKESLIAHYQKEEGKTLLIILDAFPSASLYKILTGKNSELHELLKKKSLAFNEDYTPYPFTMYSLAYLLAGNKQPGPNCHYPFFGNNDQAPVQLIGNPYIQTPDQFCQEKTPAILNPMLIRIGKKLTKRTIRCTLLSSGFAKNLNKHISSIKTNTMSKNIEIIHDTGYHDIMSNPIAIDCREQTNRGEKIYILDQLERADNCYKLSIENLLKDFKRNNSYARIVIMSDHGPRIQMPLLGTIPIFDNSLVTEQPLQKTFANKGSLLDRNYYQFFAYGIKISLSSQDKAVKLPANNENYRRFGIENKTEKARQLAP